VRGAGKRRADNDPQRTAQNFPLCMTTRASRPSTALAIESRRKTLDEMYTIHWAESLLRFCIWHGFTASRRATTRHL
jgi:hypothetical protein